MHDLNIIEKYSSDVKKLKGQYRTLDGMVKGDISNIAAFEEIKSLKSHMVIPLKTPKMKNLKSALVISIISLFAIAIGLVFWGVVDFTTFQPSINSIAHSVALQQKIGFWYEWVVPVLLTFTMLCLIFSMPLYFILDNLAKNLDQFFHDLHLKAQDNENLKFVSFEISNRMSTLNMKGLKLLSEIEKAIVKSSIEEDKAKLIGLKADLENKVVIYNNLSYLILKKLNK